MKLRLVSGASGFIKKCIHLAVALMVMTASFTAYGAPTAHAGSGDNYPWKNAIFPSCPQASIDNWGYCKRYCTSWVAWALHDRNGYTMPWAIGNASNWGPWAQANLGQNKVTMSPAIGAVAWWSSNHVAWVKAVHSNDTVTIEEYNYNNSGAYNSRTIPKNSVSGYIHFKDIVPSTPTPPAPTPPPSPLVAVRTGSNIWTTDAANNAWQNTSNTATAGFWTVTGDRTVVQDAAGLWVRDGVNGGWIRWGNGDSHEIQVSRSRIVVRNGANLYANTDPNTPWTLISNTATQGSWKLAGDRVVVQDPNGLWVKDGEANFVRWGNSDSHEIQVSSSRIVVRNGSDLYSNTAPNTAWAHISNTATEGFWKLAGNRVVVQDPNGLWVRDGETNFVRWGNGDSHEIQVSPSRIVVRNGTNIYSNTAANTAWTHISNTATEGFWTLSGDRVVLQDTNGLWVRDGDAGWVRWGNAGSDEIQAGKNN